MIYLAMGVALTVLMLWAIAATPRVIRRSNPRGWVWQAVLLVALAMASQGLLRTGFEAMGWSR